MLIARRDQNFGDLLPIRQERLVSYDTCANPWGFSRQAKSVAGQGRLALTFFRLC